MRYEIRQVSGPGDYEAAAALRYAVYAAEEGLDLAGMDHGTCTLRDAADAESIIYGAFDGGRAIATICITPMPALRPGDELRGFFGSTEFPVENSRQALIGRLMILAAHRGSPICVQLFKAAYRHFLQAGFAVGFVESSPRTIPLYESMGCRCYGTPLADPAYGLCMPMVMIADADYLQRIRSPLSSMTPASASHAALSRWFERRHLRGRAFASVRSMSRESLDAALSSLHAPGRLLCGIPAADVQGLLRHCTILDIDADTTLLENGSVGTEVYVLESGSVEIVGAGAGASRHGTRYVVGPDGAFGDGKCRVGPAVRPAGRVRTLQATRLLAISDAAFSAIDKSHAALAARLLWRLRAPVKNAYHPSALGREPLTELRDFRWESLLGASATSDSCVSP